MLQNISLKRRGKIQQLQQEGADFVRLYCSSPTLLSLSWQWPPLPVSASPHLRNPPPRSRAAVTRRGTSSHGRPPSRARRGRGTCRRRPRRSPPCSPPLPRLARFYLASRLPYLALQLFGSMPVRSAVTCNTMITGLMRNGLVAAARDVFDGMPAPDKVSWTALIDGCDKNGRHDEAIDCFRTMLLDGVKPDYVTLIAAVSACAEVGALGLGMWLHRFAVRQGLERNACVANSLIDMYARCGKVEFARQVFGSTRKRTVVSWNSMIVGFAANGRCNDAIEHFEAMRWERFKPDAVTFTGVLTACSHAGLTDEGLRYYDTMTAEYGIAARMEHYGCVVDLLGRAGRLDEAMRMVEAMPMRPNEVVLGALLAGCRMHGDVDMAEQLMQYLLELDPGGDSNYVLLSNIYAAVGKWDGEGKVRNLMKARGVKKSLVTAP